MNCNTVSASPLILGIDHGYGNIKTANFCFPTGVTAYEHEPTFKTDLLIFKDKYYQIGSGHKQFAHDKQSDNDFCILTLAAVAKELKHRSITCARVYLAVGLPLTWVSAQKEDFRAYLLQNNSVDFNYKGTAYHVDFVGADVFPQGFSAIASHLRDFTGVTLLADIGNGTMNLLYIKDRRAVETQCFTEKFGTHQCVLAAQEALLRQFGVPVDESIIEQVLRHNHADIQENYVAIIREIATQYVADIFVRLREHEYSPALMRLFVVGGGSCLVKNFGDYDANRVTILEDICATAKGYEWLAQQKMRRAGGLV